MNTGKALLGRAALLLMSIIWGSSFFILKNTLESVSTLYVLAIRFSGAAVLLCLFGLRELKQLDREYLKGGAIMGVCLFLAYVFQTYGLESTKVRMFKYKEILCCIFGQQHFLIKQGF